MLATQELPFFGHRVNGLGATGFQTSTHFLRPRSYYSIFCCDPFVMHRSYSSALLHFVRKRREKHLILSVHIDPYDQTYGAKGIRSVRSHCSGSMSLIFEYESVSKNLLFVRSYRSSEISKTSVLWISTFDRVFGNL